VEREEAAEADLKIELDLHPFRFLGLWDKLSSLLGEQAKARSIYFHTDSNNEGSRFINLQSKSCRFVILMMADGVVCFVFAKGTFSKARKGKADYINFEALPRILDRMLP
jgi:hypothetical protein